MQDFRVIEQLYSNETNRILKIARQKDNKFFIAKEIDYSQMQEKDKQHIIQEVNIQRELKSPFIVKYYDRYIDKKNQKITIIMEFCSFGDMKSLILQKQAEHQNFDEGTIWKFISQISQALLELHKRKVIHRDLQPQNIFQDDQRNFKLGDFGVSKVTKLDEIYYLSPEQINENSFSFKTDIWAFGCLIYEMMHLQPPFQGLNQMQTALKIQQGKIDISSKIYSPNLTNFLSWCLTKDPSRRPSIEDILGRPEVSFMIRQNRLTENEVLLFKRKQDISIKKEKLQQREEELNNKLSEQKMISDEKSIELDQLRRIYQDSINELQNFKPQPRQTFQRNNSLEFRDNNYMNLFKQDNINLYDKNLKTQARLSIQTGQEQHMQTKQIIKQLINQNLTTQNVHRQNQTQINLMQTKNKHLYRPHSQNQKKN